MNQWDAFSCECPLGFGGKSCAQGRRGVAIRGWGCVLSAVWKHWQGWSRHWAGRSELGCGWKSMFGQSPERVAQETKGPV